MMRLVVVLLVVGMAPLALFSGCGSSDGSAENTAGKTPPQSSLPKLGEPLPPLDDGRLLIAPPAKWERVPRGNNYLAAFAQRKTDPYPRIIVTVEDFEPIHNASASNLDDYVKQVEADLQDQAQRKKEAGSGDGKVKLIEPVKPLSVAGKFHGVQYARRAKTKDGDIFEQYYVETVKKGRRYILELRDLAETAARYKPQLYAVAGGMEFPQGETPADTAATPDESKPAEPAQPETKPETKPEPKPETKPEPKPEPKPETKPETPPKKPKFGADDF